MQGQQPAIGIADGVEQCRCLALVSGEQVADPPNHGRPTRQAGDTLQNTQRHSVGRDREDKVGREFLDGTTNKSGSGNVEPAREQQPIDSGAEPGIAGDANTHIVTGRTPAGDAVRGPVHDTTASAEHE